LVHLNSLICCQHTREFLTFVDRNLKSFLKMSLFFRQADSIALSGGIIPQRCRHINAFVKRAKAIGRGKRAKFAGLAPPGKSCYNNAVNLILGKEEPPFEAFAPAAGHGRSAGPASDFRARPRHRADLLHGYQQQSASANL
jgi:hypothetical protein